MQILSIHLKNIKSHRDTVLDFAAGINVLSGPNGVGKSTVFEAIGYALFGVDARDFVTNVERFLTIGAKRGEVAVIFCIDDGSTWRVTRTVGGGVKWLLARQQEDVFEVEEHANIRETEARLAELLGLANGRPLAEQFKLVIGPFQNDFLGPFIIKQATRRQEAFDEILGIDAWRKTFKGTSGLLSVVQNRIEVLNAEVEVRQEQVALLPERKKEQVDLQECLAGQRLALKGKHARLTEAARHLVEQDQREKALQEATGKVQELGLRITNGEEKVSDQKLRVEQARQAGQLVEKNSAGKDTFERADRKLKDLRDQERQCRELERVIGRLEKDSQALQQKLLHEGSEVQKAEQEQVAEQAQLDAARQELKPDPQLQKVADRLPSLRQQGEELRNQRGLLNGRREALVEGQDKLGEGICPFFAEPCENIAGQQPRDVFSGKIADLDQQAAQLDSRIELLGKDIFEAEQARQSLQGLLVRAGELDKQQQQLDGRRQKTLARAAGLAGLQADLTAAESRLTAARDTHKAYADLEAALSRTEQEKAASQEARDAWYAHVQDAGELLSRQQTLQKWQLALDDLKRDRQVAVEERAVCQKAYDADRHQLIRQQKEGLVAEVAALEQRLLGLDKDLQRLTGEIDRLKQIEKQIAERLAARKRCQDQEKLVKYLRNRVFKNVSARLSERFREEISQRADRIYRTIAEGDEELIWGDNYQVVLRDLADGQLRERTDDQLSGGQMMSAVVALRLALLQTIGARLAFFDEPTSNLDAARRENLARAFRAIDVGREEVTEHWYDQLFLVSHDVAFTEITDQIVELGE
jgi:exonuclease SbcC